MASEELGLVSTQRIDNKLNPQLLFQDENPLRFGCPAPHRRGVTDPDPKTQELGGLMDEKLFAVDHRDRYFSPESRRSGEVYGEGPTSERRGPLQGRDWTGGGPGLAPSSGDEDDDDDDDGDEGDDDREVEGLVRIDGSDNGGKNSAIGHKFEVGNSKNSSCFGSSTRQMIMKDGSVLQSGADVNRVSSSENGHQGRVWQFQKMVTFAEHDGYMYYSQLQGTEGSNQGRQDTDGDNGCGFSGRKESSVYGDHGESLRAIFSDPITGSLMDDAMILPCGHSFGRGGIEQVIKMKACYSCSQPVSEDSVAPNLSLRAAVQAFLREEDILIYRASKRRRERFEQDQGFYVDSSLSDTPRGRGVQFPFAVTDRVIIKGNKRTPQRFVGREAIVTTQCLNGWYVVKTLDNAESVKLQYRSLEKVVDNPCSKPMSMPAKMTPNWP